MVERGFIFDLMDEISNASNIHQALIKKFEEKFHTNLVCYIALFGHPAGAITNQDGEILENILRSIALDNKEDNLDLLLHTPGGSPEAAADIIRVCRSYSKTFRAIVPNAAMSAGTLIGMGSDEVVMSDTSKLGPIDPQMIFVQSKEVAIMRPAKSFIDAYIDLINSARSSKPATPFLHLLDRQDPSWIIECVRARNATENLAKEQLKAKMLKDKTEEEIAKVVQNFFEVGDKNTHGRSISPDEAQAFGLTIKKENKYGEFWNTVWELYVRIENYVRNRGLAKYFVSRNGGIDVQVRQLNI
jgi:Periplasmic serine proteases (ClpP class)